MSDEDLPDESEHDDEHDDDELEDDEELAPRAQAPVLGPVAGAMVGIVTFFLLGDRFSLLPRLGLSLVVIAVLAYVSVVLARRRG
jgi:hypothetical protein